MESHAQHRSLSFPGLGYISRCQIICLLVGSLLLYPSVGHTCSEESSTGSTSEVVEMRVSNNGRVLIKSFEGLRLEAYRDAVGIPTIGYGHTGGVKLGDVITMDEAESLLQKDLRRFERAVESQINVHLTQSQFDALVSFTYNVGPEALRKSTLRRILNQGDYSGAAEEFLRWVKAGGKTLPGLVKRRNAEMQLFKSSL